MTINKSEFLKKDYKLPDPPTKYMKFKQGENKFRVLSSAIVGWEYWLDTKDGRKPFRVRYQKDLPDEYADLAKHFWMFVVYNYNVSRVQVLEVTQRTIQKKMERLTRNPDWGSPEEYDLTVSRSGEGFDTEYDTTQSPKTEVDEGTVQLYKDMEIDLKYIYEGRNPFKAEREKQEEKK